ncbi:MAG: cob(I)yrinic acid a,c-diamide adenosyltransferase [bacterium]
MENERTGPRLEKGIIQIYCGNGKGKTTAAIGQAVRALGQGLAVYMAQFLKPMASFSGEIAIFERLGPWFVFHRPNTAEFIHGALPSTERQRERDLIAQEMSLARGIMAQIAYDVFIFDELLTALHIDMIEESQIVDLLRTKPEQVEIILTGLRSTQALTTMADLVTDMRSIKHPFQKGLTARRGIEY